MDAVYILGSGSLCDNLEIKYSLRALEQNMLDLRNVYIIGEKPDFLQNINHVAVKDMFEKGWQNVHVKICNACDIEDLSDEFLLMNDDFFVTDPFNGAEYPFYALKGVDGGPAGMQSYSVHCPIRFKKDWYKQLPISPEMKGHFSLRSFYANFYKASPTFIEDKILVGGLEVKSFDEQLGTHPFFSIGNGTMKEEDFVQWLEKKYPNPSKFEIVSE